MVIRFNQQDAEAVADSCESSLKLSKMHFRRKNDERADMQLNPYRSLIGCLLYITICTRPHVAYVFTQLSRFLKNPVEQY